VSWKEAVGKILKYCPGTQPVEMRKITNNSMLNSQFPTRISLKRISSVTAELTFVTDSFRQVEIVDYCDLRHSRVVRFEYHLKLCTKFSAFWFHQLHNYRHKLQMYLCAFRRQHSKWIAILHP